MVQKGLHSGAVAIPSGDGAPSNFVQNKCDDMIGDDSIQTMGRVCIPGIFCIEHMTIFLLFILVLIVTYLYHGQTVKSSSRTSSGWDAAYEKSSTPQVVLMTTPSPPTDVITVSSSDRSIYTPPLKMDLGMSMMVPRETRPTTSPFSQVGILTRTTGDQILPLMGRRLGRDKFNYYSMSTNGAINTKLPLRVKGRSGTNEYGCDELFCGDDVYVTGYNDQFRVTMYENGMYVYN